MRMEEGFSGFPTGKMSQFQIPDVLVTKLFPLIDSLEELKILIAIFWLLSRIEGVNLYLTEDDLLSNTEILPLFSDDLNNAKELILSGLMRACRRGIIIESIIREGDTSHKFYFLNSAKGRSMAEAIENQQYNPRDYPKNFQPIISEFPNIFQLYEENIGVITPMMAETLKEYSEMYPFSWIRDAVRIAVENNARNWRYVNSILERWKREGRDG